jgi:hypothetical protein
MIQYAYQYFGCNTSNVVFISIDLNDNNAACRVFEQTYQNLPGGKFPSASGTEGGGGTVCSTYGIQYYPTVILIEPNKNIVERDIWPIPSGDYLATLIQNHGGIPATCPPAGIKEIKNTTKTGFVNSYPNPANNEFNLMFNVEENSAISFEVYNLLGEKIMELSSNEYANGSYIIQIPVENFANGTYLVNLISNKVKKDICKMVIVK